ncbi:MAG: Txe/YoeB family addiction module toxin [Odoribacteraceae bacterium]|nr:Txe/YoeB family addiction module toxin [Odoribacteraceae bacterium]
MTSREKIYSIEYTRQFLSDVQAHRQSGRRSILVKIDALLEELREHPTTGTGNPEALRGDMAGLWSRRVTRVHRLVYEICEETITVIVLTAKGHYGDK